MGTEASKIGILQMKTHVSTATEAKAMRLNIFHPTLPIMVGGDGTIKPNRRENTRSDDNVTLHNITYERNETISNLSTVTRSDMITNVTAAKYMLTAVKNTPKRQKKPFGKDIDACGYNQNIHKALAGVAIYPTELSIKCH